MYYSYERITVAGYNRIIMIGNLTRDPEYKQLASGQAVCRLGLASNRQYKNKQLGTMVQEVCFIDVDVYGPQAESCREYLQKGRPVLVEGRIKFDQWETQEGQQRSKHSIVADRVVFLSSGVVAETEDDENTTAQKGLEKDVSDRIGAAQRAQERRVAPAQKAPAFKAKSIANIESESFKMNDFERTQGGDEINLKDEPPFQDDLPF
jgi:single-strand DNA-binding protein